MADNVTADAGSGGAVFATDDISGVHYPWTKIMVGAADSATALSGGNGTTDAGTLRVTVSSDSTGVLSVDDNGGSLTVDGTVTANLGATDNAVLDSIDAAVNGTLTVGSHAVTNAGTFVVQEDGAALTALQLIDDVVYVDDADWTDGSSKHALIGGLYQSTPQTITDGDVGPLQVTANGYAIVSVNGTVTVDGSGVTQPVSGTVTANLGATDNAVLDSIDSAVNGTLTVGSHAVTNAGTFAVQVDGDALTALQLLDDVVYVDDADWTDSTSKHVLTGGVYQSSPQTITDGDVGPFQVTTNGYLITSINGTVTVDGSGVTQPVSGTVTANLGATDNAVLDSIDAAVNGTLTVGSHAVTNAGTFAVQAAGDVAHDTADSGSPVKIGAKATNSIEGLTQVADADRTDLRADLNGLLLNRPHTTLEEIITERVSNTNGTSTAFTNFAAGGAGIHNYITTIAVYNSSATDGYVDFRDGTAGSIVFTAPAPATSGSIINLPVPIKFAANTAVAYDVSGALSTVYISVVGFQAQG